MEEVAGLGVTFGLLVVGFALFSLHRTVQDWLTPTLNALAHPHGGILKRAALWPLARVASGTLWIVNYVDHRLSVAASHAMAPIAHWISGLAAFTTRVATAGGAFAEDTAFAFERLTRHTIPHAIHAAVAPVAHTARLGLREAEQTAHRLRTYARGIDRLLHQRIIPGLRAVEHATTVTLPRAIGRIRTRVDSLEDRIAHPSRAWLKRLARSMWAVALFGLVIRTLARRFPWLFCRKVTNVGKRVCGLDSDLLNALLLDTLIIGGTISVVQMARELQQIEGAALAILRDGIDEL